jgi:hypothetical protein
MSERGAFPEAGGGRTVVLLDADTIAGWRRATPSLEQLHRAVGDLRTEHPDAVVAVVADPSIKWALPSEDQAAFEADIVSRAVVCAPAGTRDGTHGWLLAIADKVRSAGDHVRVVTDRAVPGLPVVFLRHDAGRFSFDLDNAREVQGVPSRPYRRRR